VLEPFIASELVGGYASPRDAFDPLSGGTVEVTDVQLDG
jgi:hypothetical protein